MHTRTFEHLIASIADLEFEQAEEVYALWCRVKPSIGVQHLHELLAVLSRVSDPRLVSLEDEVREMYLKLLESDTATLLRLLPSICRWPKMDSCLEQGLIEHLKNVIDQVKGRKVVTLFIELIRCGEKGDSMVEIVSSSLLARIKEIRTQELMELAKVLITGERTSSYLKLLSSEFLRRRGEIESFNAYGAIALLASLAHSATDDVEVATEAVMKLRGEGRSFFSQAPNMILSALSRMRDLPRSLDEAIGEWVPWISSSNLPAVLHLLSRTGRVNGPVIALLAQRAVAICNDCPLDVAVAVFIQLKRLDATDNEVKKELEVKVIERMRGSNLLALSRTLERLCELEYRKPSFVLLLMEEVRERILCEDPWLLYKLLQSMSQLLRKDDELLDRLSAVLLPQLHALPVWMVADIACAFAQLCYFNTEAIEHLKARVTPQSIEESLPKLVWSFAILDPSFARRLLQGVWSSPPDPTVSDKDLVTLYHAMVALDLPVLVVWRETLRGVLSTLATPPSNLFEQEVGKELDALVFSRSEQQQVAGYFIDHVVWLKEGPVALGCDGNQYHYLNWDRSVGLRGADLLRDRVLERRGYKVAHLSSDEWRSTTDRRQLLRRLILS